MNTPSIINMGFTDSDISVAVFKSVSQICVQVSIIPLSSLIHAYMVSCEILMPFLARYPDICSGATTVLQQDNV